MAVKFTYDGNICGVTYDAEHQDELTLEEVRTIAMLNTAHALGLLGDAISELTEAFSRKEFFDEEAVKALGVIAMGLTSGQSKKPSVKSRSAKKRPRKR